MRRALALFCLSALGACVTPESARPPASVDLYYRDLSYFHWNGDRLFYSKSGLLLVESLAGNRGGKLVLRRKQLQLPEERRRTVNAFLDSFPADRVKIADRLGIPDEVRDRFFVGPAAFDVWQLDIPKQQPEFQALMAQVSALLVDAASAPVRELEFSGEAPWPPEFERAPQAP